METDANDIMYVRIDRTMKLPITVLLRALGYSTNNEILKLLGEEEKVLRTLEKDNTENEEEGLLEIYKRLRPGEPPTVENARSLLETLFFDYKRYDLANVGRYKFNKKLRMRPRITNHKAGEDIINPLTGEVIVKANEKITRQKAEEIEKCGINEVKIISAEGNILKVIGNDFKENGTILPRDEKHIVKEDIVAAINYLVNLSHGIGLLMISTIWVIGGYVR